MGSWLIHASELLLLAQDEAPADAPEGSPFVSMLLPLAVIVVLYFVLIGGPQRQERKKTQQMLENLKKGDEVMTRGGIFGTVTSIGQEGQRITLRIDDHARMTVHRDAIGNVLSDGKKTDEKKPDEKTS